MASQDNGADEGFKAAASALNEITDMTVHNHHLDPQASLHTPSDHEASHSWISKHLPISSLQKIENSWHMGNYIIDRKTGQKSFEQMSIYVRLGMHMLYYGSKQENVLQWKQTEALLKSESEKMGKQYDTPESVSHIEPFIQSFNLGPTMNEMVEPDPKKYRNFNAFFAREIKESARPIDEPQNELVSSSPADCRLTAFQTIDLATKYWIKGYGFTLEKLFNNAQLAQNFDGGSIAIARLAPQDYHRWHAPVSGTVEQVYHIPGTYYTVNPQAINESGSLDVFCQNKRSVMIVKHATTGARIAIIAVGAMLVGSISYVSGCDAVGTQIRRGQCLGAFYYGGSTVLVLYPKGEIQIDQDIAHNSANEHCETLVKVGWRIGARQ